MWTWIWKAIDCIFPKSCIGCKKKGNSICSSCLESIPIYNKIDDRTGMSTHSVFLYTKNSLFAKLIRAGKYSHMRSVLSTLTQKASPYIPIEWQHSNVILVPVPLHFWRKQQRGYNQSEIIAQSLQTIYPHWDIIPMVRRTKNNTQQAKLKKNERLENVKDIFSFSYEYESIVPKNAIIVCIDDVVSSGATLCEMKKCLEKSGYTTLAAWCLGSGRI